jgi:tetratricopeptide (TPR) repeat protein
MPATQRYDYDVALSHAGEDRDKAELLAAALRSRGVKVFYDKYEKSNLWGKDLYTHLSEVYQNKAHYCIPFFSQHYAAKVWTKLELKSAQARAMQENKEYLLPVRLDETEIPGILPTIAYLSWPPETAETIADAIMDKLHDVLQESVSPTSQASPETVDIAKTTFVAGPLSNQIHPVQDIDEERLQKPAIVPEVSPIPTGTRQIARIPPRTELDPETASRNAQEWMDKGNAAAQEGDYEAAAEAFERAVIATPEDARTRYNLALAHQYLGDAELAIAGYRRAIDLDPQLIDSYINLGNLYGELGMREEALETFQQALEFDLDNDELYLHAGDSYRNLNLYEDAIQAYRQALILNPENTLAADNLRDVREHVTEQMRRIPDQEKLVDEDPGDISRHAELVSLYLDMRRYVQALSVANQMLGLAPEDRTVYDTLASVYQAIGDPGQAAEIYARIVTLSPDDADAWEHLGTWRSLEGNREEAIQAYEQSVQLDPTRYTARFSLAEAYLEAERYEDAINAYQALINTGSNLDPDDLAAAYAGLADTYNSMDRYEDAIQTSQTLLEQFEGDPEGHYQLATAYDALGRYDEAIADYQKAIASDPLNADYYNDLADTLRIAKRYDEALDMIQQAIAMDPSMIITYETLSQIHEEMGHPQEAAEAMELANTLRAARA